MNNTFCDNSSLTNLNNFINASDYCFNCDKNNTFCGIYDARRVFEIVYLCFVILTGTCGNLLVILSITHARRLYKHGNIFIVNLAVADLIVSLINNYYFRKKITTHLFRRFVIDQFNYLLYLLITLNEL